MKKTKNPIKKCFGHQRQHPYAQRQKGATHKTCKLLSFTFDSYTGNAVTYSG